MIINGSKVATVGAVLRNGDIISHTLHRHEPPVTATPIGIVHEDNDMIVINKPAGVPVHPAGRYNFNSIVEIMRAQRGHAWNPLPCNRLDRLTSGIMFIGKHPRAAERLSMQIQDRKVTKEYVARVIGEFPAGKDVVCDQPIMQISPKLGLNRARASGKPARTVFTRLAYYPPPQPPIHRGQPPAAAAVAREEDKEEEEAKLPHSSSFSSSPKSHSGHSIVLCRPLTGRTHQLRVHLQYLGHPIANDPIYCNARIFGPGLAAGDALSDDDAAVVARLARMGKDETADARAYHDAIIADYQARKAEKMTGETCALCETPLYSDPGAHELGIYLHAKRYACQEAGWAF